MISEIITTIGLTEVHITMDVNTTPQNREILGKVVSRVVNETFNQGTSVSVHWNLENAETEHTGIYVSAFIHNDGVTRSERQNLEDAGLHLVEQAAHIVENPGMSDSVTNVPRDELSDAAETDTELVLELDKTFIEDAL